ncbi:MAG: carboxypeptidase regulatory-like domain-containing protein [Planctomycetes bacterium]|nr:carboxypeptidase regulatory-like domain-containing protein [Planctomycetota bacterium]
MTRAIALLGCFLAAAAAAAAAPAQALTVTGRVLDAGGTPLANSQLWVTVCGRTTATMTQVRSDAEGRVAFAPDVRHLLPDETARLEIRTGEHRGGARVPVGVVRLRGDRRDALDLQDLRLVLPPPLLRGRVVDGGGRPVPGVLVAAPWSVQASSEFAAPGHRATTDAEGRFVLYELDPEPLPLRLSVFGSGWLLEAPVDAMPGDEQVELRVVAPGSIVLQLRDPHPAADLLWWQLRTGRGEAQRVAIPQRGVARFENLAPGRYDLTLLLVDREVARFDGVEVKVGAPCDLPALGDVPWRTAVRLVDVRLCDSAGAPLRGRVQLVGGGKGGVPRAAECDAAGDATAPFVAGLRLVAEFPGLCRREVLPGAGRIKVRLHARARLRLRLPDGIALPDGVQIHCDTEWTALGLQSPPVQWRGGNPVFVEPDSDGGFTLRFEMRDELGGRRLLWKQDVGLPEEGAPDEVLVTIDAEAAAEAAAIAAALRGR